MEMKILLFGANGQVGRELLERLSTLGEVLALTRSGVGTYVGDLNDLKGIDKTIRKYRPTVVFNAAAYTNVDQAEEETDVALRINAKAPIVMANACKACDALFIHYSSDYVYGGMGTAPWVETDELRPLNTYGRSKVLSDIGIKDSGCQHLILRTSWVYGIHGRNFVNTVLRLARVHDTIDVVGDQIGAPTSAGFIAQISVLMALKFLKQGLEEGVYHLVPNGYVSRSDFARYIIRYLNRFGKQKLVKVNDILTRDYRSNAIRPLNSRLSNDKIQKVLPKNCVKGWQYYLEKDLSVLIHDK